MIGIRTCTYKLIIIIHYTSYIHYIIHYYTINFDILEFWNFLIRSTLNWCNVLDDAYRRKDQKQEER